MLIPMREAAERSGAHVASLFRAYQRHDIKGKKMGRGATDPVHLDIESLNAWIRVHNLKYKRLREIPNGKE